MTTVVDSSSSTDITIAGDWDASAWNTFALAAGADGHVHAYAWRNIFWRALKHRPHYLIARRNRSITGILPLFDVKSRLFGRSLISVPFLNGGGILAKDDASATALLRHAQGMMHHHGYRYVELRHRRDEPLMANLVSQRQRVAMRLALPENPEVLFESLKAKLRSQIRRPVKAGARAQIINGSNIVERDIESLYRVYAESMRDLGIPVFPKSLFRETLRSFGDEAWLVIVWLDGHPAAFGLMIGFGAAIEMAWASSLRCFDRLSVNMLLYWEAIRTAIDQRYQVFDFGRSAVDGPTYRFVTQWGATPLSLPWYYLGSKENIPDLSSTSARFPLAMRAWKALPTPIANRIGPMIARSLP